MTPRPTDAAIEGAGRILAAGYAHMDSLTPDEAAREAYVPGGPTVEELAERIRARREPANGRQSA